MLYTTSCAEVGVRLASSLMESGYKVAAHSGQAEKATTLQAHVSVMLQVSSREEQHGIERPLQYVFQFVFLHDPVIINLYLMTC